MAEPRHENKPRRIRQSSDGLIEDSAAQGFREWARKSGVQQEDTRSLAELAASVMDAPEGESHDAVRAPDSEAGDGLAVASLAAGVIEETLQAGTGEARDKRRRAQTLAAALGTCAVVAAALGYGLFGGGSGPGSPGAGEIAAAPPAGQPPVEAALPSPNDAQPQAVVVAPTDAPVATATPVPPPPAAPVPSPAVAPTPGLAVTVHVADLDSQTRKVGGKVKIAVDVLVHDAAHNPVAGATVSGSWSAASGATSCVTGANGSCVVETTPLAPGGSVTFTVGGIAYSGATYEAGLNHDPDGDSNGTSITVS